MLFFEAPRFRYVRIVSGWWVFHWLGGRPNVLQQLVYLRRALQQMHDHSLHMHRHVQVVAMRAGNQCHQARIANARSQATCERVAC